MARRRFTKSSSALVHRDPLLARSLRLCRKGEYRKASVALRQLVSRTRCAAHWTRLGLVLLQAGRDARALDALKQAKWLHERAGYPGRARAIEPWLERARLGSGAGVVCAA
jgi:Flp pilus assembly protein TadD